MKTHLLAIFAVVAMGISIPSFGDSNRDSGGSNGKLSNYQDLSQVKSRRADRDKKKKEEADAAKKKADQAKNDKNSKDKNSKDKNGSTHGFSRVGSNDKHTSGSASSRSGKKPGSGSAASGHYEQSGQYKEVTQVMLDAVKTRRVNFDEQKAAKNPDIILLNEPVFKKGDNPEAGTSSLASPL